MKRSVYSAVCTAGTASEVRAYLYEHTKVASVASEGRRTYLVLCTTAEGPNAVDAQRQAEYLAQYQCDRLSSGLHGARVCFDRKQATEHLQAFEAKPLHWHNAPTRVW